MHESPHQGIMRRLVRACGDGGIVRDVCLGQLLSLLITMTAVCSELLVRRGFEAPSAQNTLNYFLLALVYGAVLLKRGNSLPWPRMSLLALADVEANYIIVLAYQYTSITSVTLLDCATIPFAMAFSHLALGTRYKRGHYLGVSFAIAGISALMLGDATEQSNTKGSALQGDLLVVLGAALYAVSNVAEEMFVHAASTVEVLALLGAFGSVISCAQMLLFEREQLRSCTWGTPVVMPLAGFVAALFLFYSLVPIMLKARGVAAFNLSLLTSDLFTAAARAVLFDGFSTVKSVIALSCAVVLVAIGLVIFYCEKPSTTCAANVCEDEIAEANEACEGSKDALLPLSTSGNEDEE